MKKLIASIVALIAVNASAYTVTNTVTIVSNIYNRIAREIWITNNVKNTHANYFYTNNVYTVSNITLLVSQTNVRTTVTYDMGMDMVTAASNHMDKARLYAESAAESVDIVTNLVNTISTNMDARQEWFDDNFGKMVTNVNFYIAEDREARTNINLVSERVRELEKSSKSRFKFDYEYEVYYRLEVGGESIWANVGRFRVDPLSANLISTDESGTKKYGYDFVNDSSSQYKMVVSAVYKYVPASGQSYMVVIGDKGASDHAVVSDADEKVLYGSDSRVVISEDYKFGCVIVGGVFGLDVVDDGLEKIGEELYRRKVKVVLNNVSNEVGTVVMDDRLDKDLNSVSNTLETSIADLRTTVSTYDAAISSLSDSVSNLGSNVNDVVKSVNAVEADVSNLKNMFGSHKYKSASGTVYERIDVYSIATNGNRVAAYATGQQPVPYYTVTGASLGYSVYISERFVLNPNVEYWNVVPSFAEFFTDGGVKLHFVPTTRRALSSSSHAADAGCVYLLEDFYWSDGYLYCVVTSYLNGVFRGRIRYKFADGTEWDYDMSNVRFPDSIYSKESDWRSSVHMKFDNREGTIMDNMILDGIISFKTTTGSVAEEGLPVTFPGSPSMSAMINMIWYSTYGQ